MSLGAFLAGLHRPGMKWTGQISSVEPLLVRAGESDIPCVQVGAWAPVVGFHVMVENLGGRAYALGVIFPHARPDTVTVTDTVAYTPDASGNPVIVPGHLTGEAYGRTYNLRYLPAYTPTVGDVVGVQWEVPTGLVVGVIAAAVGTAVNPAVTQTSSGKVIGRALDARSWRGGKWRTDSAVITQGDYQGAYGQSTGSFFYGAQLVVPGGIATSARIRLNRIRGGANYSSGEPVHLHHHTSTDRPASDVTRDIGPRDVTVPLGAAWYPLDLEIAQALLAGGGVSIAGDPYVNLADIDSDPESGLVEIQWITT